MNDKQLLNGARRARKHLHAAKGYDPAGGHYRSVDDYLDAVEAEMKQRLKPPAHLWQDIGPIQPGGASLLDMVLTHDTSGIPLFPAVDTAWGRYGGVIVIAPEQVTVDTKDTSANPGEAVYLKGRSGMRYWVGHLDRDWPLGTVIAKGAVLGKTLPIVGDSDHAHVGVNAEAFLGKGKELYWGGAPGRKPVRYRGGSPTIRQQLEALEL